jgi:hypothetical protein
MLAGYYHGRKKGQGLTIFAISKNANLYLVNIPGRQHCKGGEKLLRPKLGA